MACGHGDIDLAEPLRFAAGNIVAVETNSSDAFTTPTFSNLCVPACTRMRPRLPLRRGPTWRLPLTRMSHADADFEPATDAAVAADHHDRRFRRFRPPRRLSGLDRSPKRLCSGR